MKQTLTELKGDRQQHKDSRFQYTTFKMYRTLRQKNKKTQNLNSIDLMDRHRALHLTPFQLGKDFEFYCEWDGKPLKAKVYF